MGQTMHKFFRRSLLILTAAALVALSGCAGRRSITVGIARDAPPLSSAQDGQPVGFVVEMAREAGKRMGMEVNFKFVDTSDISGNLEKLGVDALWGRIVPDAATEKNLLLTQSYMKDSEVLVVSADSRFEERSDLKPEGVGAVKGSAAQSALKKAGLGGGTVYNDPVSAFIALRGGKVDALAVDESYARSLMTEHAELYRILDGDLADEAYAVAVRRNDSILCGDFSKALSAMKADGTSAGISKKWFGADMT